MMEIKRETKRHYRSYSATLCRKCLKIREILFCTDCMGGNLQLRSNDRSVSCIFCEEKRSNHVNQLNQSFESVVH